MLSDAVDATEDGCTTSSVHLVEFERQSSGYCGFHLTRSRWDPYPWVSKVDASSPADIAGVHSGDCILEINGEDIVGKRISEVADRVRSGSNQVSLLLWNSGSDPQCTPESLCCGPMTQNLQRLSICMSKILTALECPICLDTIPPPAYQCENGHLTCLRCRVKSERCPVCRIRLSRGRSLFAEQTFNTITEVFQLKDVSEQIRKTEMRKIFKLRDQNQTNQDKATQSHTNKFLARLIGKSTSVDNLSSNSSSKSTIPTIQISLDHDFNTSNLKTRSLSSNEIFRSISPASSRAGSFYHLHGQSRFLGEKYTHLRSEPNESNPSSYQGSLESLDRKLKEDDRSLNGNLLKVPVNSISNDKLTYQCPYNSNCSCLIKGSEIFQHFRTSHDGPLVQYFQPKIRLSLANIDIEKNLCYVINEDDMIFFLQILDVSDYNKCNAVLLWMWLLGDFNASNKFQLQMRILNAEEEVLLSLTSAIYSLEQVTWKTITENRRGIFLNSHTLETFSSKKSETFFDFEICKINTEGISR